MRVSKSMMTTTANDDEESFDNNRRGGNVVMKAGGGINSFSRNDSNDMRLFDEQHAARFPWELQEWKKEWIYRGLAMVLLYLVLTLLPSSSSDLNSPLGEFSPSTSPGTEWDCSRGDDNLPSECLPFSGIDAEGYDEWYKSKKIGIKYPSKIYMPSSDPGTPESGVVIHWKVEGQYVNLAVAARSEGWVGFGLAEAGGMAGADMVIFEARNPTTLIDAYTDDMKYPQIDECSNDWEFVDSHIDSKNGFIMFEGKRLLDTKDTQDRPIIDDASTLIAPHRVIAAWGDSTSFGHHGLNRARGAIRFHSQDDELTAFKADMDRSAEGFFDVRADDHHLQGRTTEYAFNCVSRDELLSTQNDIVPDDARLHIVGFQPVLMAKTKVYVHHIFLFGHQHENCQGGETPVYVWAPGEGPLALPENLGSPLFGEDGYQSFTLQVHYNNPDMTEGIVDNSGIRLHWTSQIREDDMGMLVLGHEVRRVNFGPNSVINKKVGAGLTRHEFELPEECTAKIPQPLTILREILHLHGHGIRSSNQLIRRGEVIHTGSVDYWDFEQSANVVVHEDPFIMNPGDSYKINCFYNADNTTRFGAGAGAEMCLSFVYYYPKTDKIQCDCMHNSTTLKDQSEVGRTFGNPKDQCM